MLKNVQDKCQEVLENKISESSKSLVMLQFPKSAKPEQLTSRTEAFSGAVSGKTEQLVTLMLTALTRLTNLRQKSKAKFNCSGELTKAPGQVLYTGKKGEWQGESQRIRMELFYSSSPMQTLRARTKGGRRAEDEKGPSVTDHTHTEPQ